MPDTMTNEELKKFYDELPEYCQVPTNDDGTGELIALHKSKITIAHLERMVNYDKREAHRLRLESDLDLLLLAEVRRRGGRNDQKMGEVFPEGLAMAFAPIAARWVHEADSPAETGLRQAVVNQWLARNGLLPKRAS